MLLLCDSLTEHKNAIKPEDARSIPSKHIIKNDHRFDWTNVKLLNHGKTKEAREFKETWHTLQNPTISRHIDIPTAHHPLQHHNTNRGLQTTNKKPEPNQPMSTRQNHPKSIVQNQPIKNQEIQPIRR